MFKKRHIHPLIIIGGVVAAILVATATVSWINHQFIGYISADKTQFAKDSAPKATGLAQLASQHKISALNPDGTIQYLRDDFSSYADVTQKVITPFTGTEGVTVTPLSGPLTTSKDAYEGPSSLVVPIVGNKNNQITIMQHLLQPVDLSRWSNTGFATMWLKTADRMGISSTALRLTDNKGNSRTYTALPNLQTNFPNTLENDPFIDLPLPQAGETPKWTDFWLAKGWNYLFWRADQGNYTNAGAVDLSHIQSASLILTTTSALQKQDISLNDLRMVDGLQKVNNELAGNWYPPLEAPQYGVYDINKTGNQASLKLLNVRQEQYPSNGDHGRLLSAGGTPLNFASKIRFSANNLTGDTNNSWVRFQYDFDPSYDPGHDWFGSYLSLDYHKFGLLTVIPLQRFTIQTQEPLDGSDNGTYRTPFTAKANQQYELDTTVHGQTNTTTLYLIKGSKLKALATLHYTFKRPREKQRNPIGIEVTGNVKATINDIEVVQL